MSTRFVLLTAFALAIAGIACQPPAQEVASTEVDESAIKSVIAELVAAANAGDANRFLETFAADIVVMPPNQSDVIGENKVQPE
ncbi:MAG: hypothetical protein ACE5O2_17705 [Armatimonadota bacterium]